MNEPDKITLGRLRQLLEDIEKEREVCREIMTQEQHNLYKLDQAEQEAKELINDILDRNKKCN